ncbi:MAG TPA: Rrf2 family transcriptional regulator, partial [Spirochaetia bacterium]|nr:Rrf2 family transcriptional regulator [Spirochaetia bacterium]
HGLIYMAKAPLNSTALITDIAGAISVPEPYLRKIFQQLVKRGIVTSQRGSRGGFHLARDPGQITLKEIVEAIDGSLPIYTCLKIQRNCSMSSACPVQSVFEKARLKMAEVLEGTSIKDLLEEITGNPDETSWLRVTA